VLDNHKAVKADMSASQEQLAMTADADTSNGYLSGESKVAPTTPNNKTTSKVSRRPHFSTADISQFPQF
jgi:hypothetical protein